MDPILAFTFSLDIKLPPELDGLVRTVQQWPHMLTILSVGLVLLTITLTYLLFNKNPAARIAGVALLGSCTLWLFSSYRGQEPVAQPKPPLVKPEPPKPPRKPILPWRDMEDVFDISNALAFSPEMIGEIKEGGPKSPDGKCEVCTDLPVELRLKNVGGTDGAGLCVFTSMWMAASSWQNIVEMRDFRKNMQKERGGGYPSKVDAMMKKYAPTVDYLQYEGKDPAVLVAALKSGRMPSVTYNGRDVHYRSSIAHMVNLVYYDESSGWAAIMDNNFIGESQLVWMNCAEFKSRWCGGGNGWAVVFLGPRPPAPPRSPKMQMSLALAR